MQVHHKFSYKLHLTSRGSFFQTFTLFLTTNGLHRQKDNLLTLKRDSDSLNTFFLCALLLVFKDERFYLCLCLICALEMKGASESGNTADWSVCELAQSHPKLLLHNPVSITWMLHNRAGIWCCCPTLPVTAWDQNANLHAQQPGKETKASSEAPTVL